MERNEDATEQSIYWPCCRGIALCIHPAASLNPTKSYGTRAKYCIIPRALKSSRCVRAMITRYS
ncbi:hypothetical protein COCVIDRAFT_39233 [Bipolaris victoriae FI3]|uniref:Uncharacterized protein n=1 Tax=Bipolaris victoriae (strain FI3) TaxID=930091 RepID=W7EAV3_BIPV3|nr:hypothetical protein COCVIDRAFT_39233 [Bipolaris victoriae FI3]